MNTFKHKVSDVLVIVRELWFMVLLQLLAIVAFVFVPQGQEMINAIMDDFGQTALFFHKFLALLLSQVALLFWAIQTGFGARVLLLFSDISFYPGKPIGTSQEDVLLFEEQVDQRVKRRKRFANQIPIWLTVVPSVIMLLAYLRSFITYSQDGNLVVGFIICVALTLITGWFSFIAIKYWLDNKVIQWHKEHEGQQKAFNSLKQINSLAEVGLVRKAFLIMICLAVGILVFYCIAGIRFYQFVGALHLITMGFGVWVAIAWWVDYLDKRETWFVKPALFGFICLVSYFNQDHPARLRQDACSKPNQSITDRFDSWFVNSNFDTSKQVPVFFVSAEGGASRSAFWTAQVLSHLTDTSKKFGEHIFSFSSVSGGTLGVNLYNCLYKETEPAKSKNTFAKRTSDFFSEDFLAPETGRMVFGELFNLLSFYMIPMFDRAGALEIAWENSWHDHINADENPMASSFNDVNKDGKVVLINSTEVETGKRAVFSNVKIDHYFNDVVNMQERIGVNVNYSTAILFSARFPYLSPAAKIQPPDTPKDKRRHFVDGGYFENMGNLTTMEVIAAVKKHSKWGKKITPVILLITNDDTTSKVKPLLFGNELLEPPFTMLSVRSGHTAHVLTQTKQFITANEIGGELIRFNMPLNENIVPMNWFISEKAKARVMQLFEQPHYYQEMNKVINLLE